MTLARVALASLSYYRRTHVAVALGVAAATAVLAGSLLVGTSVRASLESISTSRLGQASVVVGSQQPFTEALGQRLASATGRAVAPLLSLSGLVRHESSSRRASSVSIYGVDDRFFKFHGVQAVAIQPGDVLISQDLAAEIAAAPGDALVVRLSRPTDVPIDSLHGRREDAGRSLRLFLKSVLTREQMGEFSLTPGQGPVRVAFVSLERLQRDLDLEKRVNSLLAAGAADAGDVRRAIDTAATHDDRGIKISTLPIAEAVIVESAAGLVSDALAAAVTSAADATGRRVTPVLTWLANRMTVGTHQVPYSLVTALGPRAAGNAELAKLLALPTKHPALVLNAWTARELSAKPGDAIELEYFRWADEGKLVTERSTFEVAGIVPMSSLAIDRRLAPDYPGITTAMNLTDWDPPFPIDLRQVDKADEDYWDQYRTAPKAFIPLAAGQSLWRSKYGQLTSVRVSGTEPLDVTMQESGFNVIGVRAERIAASAGATDFGAYFSYFSFFLMVAALMLAALFFRLSIEQRVTQIGVLRATGFSQAAIRRALLIEGMMVAAAGAAAGAVLAVAWAGLMMFALRTWWVGAVGTTLLELHLDAASLVIGSVAALAAAGLSIFLTVRHLSKLTPRNLLSGVLPVTSAARRSRVKIVAIAALAGAVALSVLAGIGSMPAAAGFFGAGALVLIGGLAAFRQWLARSSAPANLGSRNALGMRNASWRPGRSLTAAGLVAAALFLLVSVDSFRKTAGATGSRTSGTGGFALLAESSVPIVHDLQSADGRTAVGLPASSLDGVSIFSLRLRPGDDTSCLNLYQPKQPRVVGVPTKLIAESRFRFARFVDDAPETARENPWTLLTAGSDEVVPAIVDQTSLQYVLHAAVGDTITIDQDTSRPIPLRIVASLDDSALQGEILISETAFQRLFPQIAGYRLFLIDVSAESADRTGSVSQTLESSLEPFGFDAQSVMARLEAYHRVENTYLSTFQALGGLGLVLGCFGLIAVIARNVLERRRELALLGAAGFTGRDLQRVVAIEHLLLVAVGLGIGLAAAGLAVAPVVISRGGAPWHALVWVLPVALAGFGAAALATRSLRRLPLVASLRSE